MTHPGGMVDADARRRAATDFEVNLVVSAAAGTGKTSLLVERILNAVGSGAYVLDEMAAVTFTRKAAAEMRARLALGLERLRELAAGAAEGEDAGEAARARSWLVGERGVDARQLEQRALEGLEALDRFSVSTIHSLCAEILRLHPLEAGVDPGFSEDEGPHLEEVFERTWRAFLEDGLGDTAGPRAPAWRRSLTLFSLEEIKQAARAVAEFGFPAPEQWNERPQSAAAVLEPVLRPLIDEAGGFLERAGDFNPNFRAFLESACVLARAFLAGEWIGGAEPPPAVLPFPLLEKDVPSVGAPFTRADPAAAEAAKRFARHAAGRLRSLVDLHEEAVAALLEPLREFVPRFREAYLGEGWVSFDALLTLTRDLLRDHPGVRRALHRRFRHLLVDEFQDTDPVQYEILLLLAEADGAPSARDAYQAVLEPGRLFIVGDPKQSIYRFRKADIAAYQDAVERIRSQGGALLSLTTNFRSEASLLEALNVLFTAEFSADRDRPGDPAGRYQPGYEPMAASQPAGETGPAVELWSTGGAALKADERREIEARGIAAWISQHAAPDGDIPLREVGILFRVTIEMAVYLEALRSAGVPVVVEGGKEFLNRPEVRHLRALLRCLSRPQDSAALLAFLRSPVGAASDRDLLEHARAGARWHLLEPDRPDSPSSVRRALGWLRELERAVRDLPAEEQILIALERAGLELVEASHPDGAQNLANLRRYALALAACAREQGLSLEQAIQGVEARDEAGAAGVQESPLADETLEAVRVLTVHKAKGMEFDVVIVPDLCRGGPPPHAAAVEVDWLRTHTGGLSVRTLRGVNAWRLVHEHEEARHEEAEALRTLYVACTRPRRRLILLAGPGDAKEAARRWPAALRRWNYDAEHPPADGAGLAPGVVHRDVSGWSAGRVAAPPAPDVRAEVERFVEASARARAAARDWEKHPSGLVESAWERQEAAEGPPASLAQAPAIVLGRVIHQALERWDGRGDGRALLQEAVRRQATEAGVEAGAVEREAQALWERVRGSPLAALLREGEVRGREVPILMEEEGTVWRGSLDLLYRRREGEWVVADYKTEDPGADPEEHARRYLPQLRVYARAVERALGARPRAEIFWVRRGTFTRFRPEELEGPLD